MDTPSPSIKDRLNDVMNRMEGAALRSGRNARDIQLVAVTKTYPVDLIIPAIDGGVKALGESKIQEAAPKLNEIRQKRGNSLPEFHLIGSLQTNKVRKAVQTFDLIQSVDRPKLAQFLDRVASEEEKIQRCLVEVKISPENSKAGIPVKEAADFIRQFSQYSHLQLEGLMTMAPFDISPEETRSYFRKFRRFFESEISFLGPRPIISMGMTDDFEMAIEEGSNMVRIGRAIFGERTKSVPGP